jgi:two-component system sensor histidine kinase TctE
LRSWWPAGADPAHRFDGIDSLAFLIDLDRAGHVLRGAGRAIELTPREWSILEYLMLHAETVVRKDKLLQAISGGDDNIAPNAVEVYVSRLRARSRAPAWRWHRARGRRLERARRLIPRAVATTRTSRSRTRVVVRATGSGRCRARCWGGRRAGPAPTRQRQRANAPTPRQRRRGAAGRVRMRLLLPGWCCPCRVVILASLMDYRAIDRTVDEAFDQVLLNSAVAVGESIRRGETPDSIRLPVERLKVLLSDPIDTLDYRIVGSHGEHLAGTADLALPPDDSDPAFYDLVHRGNDLRAVRVTADTDVGIVAVVVAETQRKRRNSQDRLRSTLVVEDTVILALTVGLCLLAVRMSLKPLERLAGQLAQRSPADLTPVSLGSTPGEVRPLADALNRLFGRLAESRDAQRRFVENAAHQLRTH